MVNPSRFYTYAYLREDGTPYYIGKGKGKRAYKKGREEVGKPTDKSRIIYLKQNITEDEAIKHEIYMIAVFGRKDLGTGILRNKTNGGDGASGYKHSEEVCLSFRERMIGNQLAKGYKHSLEAREKISKANTGRIYPEERNKKISLSKIGHSVSEETKQKLREHNVKYLYEITNPEGQIYITDNLNHFCKLNGLDTAAMQRVCSGKQKSHTPKRKDRVPNTIGWTVCILEHLT
jgi:ribosomal protein L24E